MKHYRRFRLILDTIHTLVFAVGTAFICWYLYQLFLIFSLFE
jgi:hypothetical protein